MGSLLSEVDATVKFFNGAFDATLQDPTVAPFQHFFSLRPS